MSPVSATPTERARKTHSTVLQRMQEPGIQAAIAAAQGVSESTISRIKSDKLEDAILLLMHLGFKVVPEGKVCVDRSMYEALTTIASKAMADGAISRKLVWEDE